MQKTDSVNNAAFWMAGAVVLLVVTALQVLVVVLNLVDGSSVPLSTLSGIVTLILGIYAIAQVRRIRGRETNR